MSKYEDNQKRLGPAFDLVKPTPHWKAEILAWIDKDQLELVSEAVGYYAGGQLEVVEDDGAGRVQVYAPGYWAIIGS